MPMLVWSDVHPMHRPKNALRTMSMTRRDSAVCELKIKTEVARPVSFATFAISRASQTVCAIGFWLYTCFPARMAAMAITACQ
jgi:hypothetical protein